jgi:2-hydroxy-3-keto-5-methylthiopentenyl-1-phosphate phosphatase
MKPSWVVASDFDGTLTKLDVGNEIHKSVKPQDFIDLQAAYRRGDISLKELQRQMWQDFPLSESEFRKRALSFAELREGVNEYLELCLDHSIPVYVASCGIEQYIAPVLDTLLSPKARKAILGLKCNRAVFDSQKLAEFIPPDSDAESPYPLDKGAWIQQIRSQKHPGSKVLGIGNGSSDRSFIGQVDLLAATEALAKWCDNQNIPYQPFEDFHELIQKRPF